MTVPWLPLLAAAFLAAAVTPILRAQDAITEQGAKTAESSDRKVNADPSDGINILTGQVLDEATRAPVADVIVAVAAVDVGSIYWASGADVYTSGPEQKVFFFFSKRNGKQADKATTDSRGRFEIRGLAHGDYNLAAILPYKGLTLKENIAFEKDTDALEVLLKPLPLEPSAVDLVGRVLDHQGKPVAHANVAAANAEKGYVYCYGADMLQAQYFGGFDGDPSWFTRRVGRGHSGLTTTDDDGRFTIPALKRAVYNVVAIDAEKGVEIVESQELTKESEPLEIKLAEPSFLEGRTKGLLTGMENRPRFGGLFNIGSSVNWTVCNLVPEGLPANVHFNFSIMVGDYDFPRVGPLPKAKKWTLTATKLVEKQGYWATLLSAPVEIQPGKTAKVDIDLTEGVELSGKVRGPDGEPLSGVSVLAKASGENGRAIGAVTDKKGEYTIKGLSDGEFVLEILRHALRTAPG